MTILVVVFNVDITTKPMQCNTHNDHHAGNSGQSLSYLATQHKLYSFREGTCTTVQDIQNALLYYTHVHSPPKDTAHFQEVNNWMNVGYWNLFNQQYANACVRDVDGAVRVKVWGGKENNSA